MEHRCTDRYPSDLKILIYKHGLPIAIGRIKNGGRMGVYVETDFMDVDCEHQLTLEVMPSRQNPRLSIPMKAIVIHKTGHGFGAELDIETHEQSRTFLDMLRGMSYQMQQQQEFAVAANG